MKSTKIMPPTWMLIAMIAMVGLHFLVPVASIIPRFWNLSGPLLIILGLAISLVADNAFKKAGTTIKPFQESSTLVTDGVFQISRNPMYLAMVLILTGIAVLLRSLSPFLMIIPFAILIERSYIRIEEQMLAKTFGSRWESYRINTRRWL